MKKIIVLLITFSLNSFMQAQIKNIKVNSYLLGKCTEPSIAVNPLNPNNIAIGANNTYCFYSFDNAETWNEIKMGSTYGVWGDPTLGFDSEGNLYFSHLSGEPPLSGRWVDRIVIQKSLDGGKTWNDGTFTGLNRPKHEDKSWMTIADKNSIYKDNIYIAWTETDQIFNPGPSFKSRILFSYSNDKAETWSDPISISDVEGDCLDDDNTVEGAVPAIGPDGEIYIAWSGPAGIVFDKSLDGGLTFGDDISISPQIGGWAWDNDEVIGVRGNGMPQTLCDVGNSEHRGTIYIIWADQRNGVSNTDIFLKKSTDKGITWSDAVRVNNDDTQKAQFFPWACIDPLTGKLYIVFYDRRNTTGTSTDVYIAESIDGGVTFTNQMISETSFSNNYGVFTGDYINMQFLDGKLYPVWTRVDEDKTSIMTAVLTESVLTSVKKEKGFFNYKLLQNYPNPVKKNTTISFQIKEAEQVLLKVYDSYGKEIAELVNGYKMPGEYNVFFDATNLKSGSYFYKMIVGEKILSKKMLVIN